MNSSTSAPTAADSNRAEPAPADGVEGLFRRVIDSAPVHPLLMPIRLYRGVASSAAQGIAKADDV